jgi:hypothetical protein
VAHRGQPVGLERLCNLFGSPIPQFSFGNELMPTYRGIDFSISTKSNEE